MQLASVLKAVVSQRLIPRADGGGRGPAVEVLISTPFIKDCIVDKEKTHLIHNAIAQGTSQYGMQTFDQSLMRLLQQAVITGAEATRQASNPADFIAGSAARAVWNADERLMARIASHFSAGN